MIPFNLFIDNLFLAYRIRRLEGNVVECGVWRGGMIAGMSVILKPNRTFFLFDSFEGLPLAKEIDGQSAIQWQSDKSSKFYFDNCRAEMEYAQAAMVKAGPVKYELIKGWFADTFSGVDCGEIALLRLDADWYESTLLCLEKFYDHVKPGGLIILDDYYTWDGCAKALHEFLATRKSNARIHSTRNGVCYLIR